MAPKLDDLGSDPMNGMTGGVVCGGEGGGGVKLHIVAKTCLNEEGEDDHDVDAVSEAALHRADAKNNAQHCTAHLDKEQPPEPAPHAHLPAQPVGKDATCKQMSGAWVQWGEGGGFANRGESALEGHGRKHSGRW